MAIRKEWRGLEECDEKSFHDHIHSARIKSQTVRLDEWQHTSPQRRGRLRTF